MEGCGLCGQVRRLRPPAAGSIQRCRCVSGKEHPNHLRRLGGGGGVKLSPLFGGYNPPVGGATRATRHRSLYNQTGALLDGWNDVVLEKAGSRVY